MAAATDRLDDNPAADLSIAGLATTAGVSYSTVARRWDELCEPLASMRVHRLLDGIEPSDLGACAIEIQTWAEALAERLLIWRGARLSKTPDDIPAACFVRAVDRTVREQLRDLCARSRSRGERLPGIPAVTVRIVAPLMYRALTGEDADVHQLVASALWDWDIVPQKKDLS